MRAPFPEAEGMLLAIQLAFLAYNQINNPLATAWAKLQREIVAILLIHSHFQEVSARIP